MSNTGKNRNRVINYTTGLLDYYGAINNKELLKLINQHLELKLEQQDLDNIITEALSAENTSILFNRHRDILYSLEVEDLKNLLNEQTSHKDIPYRPVTEKEAEAACRPLMIPTAIQNYKNLLCTRKTYKLMAETICCETHRN